MAFYVPIMLDCKGMPIVIFGGGEIAARKAGPMIEAGAHVTIVSPNLCTGLKRLHAAELIRWLDKTYMEGDLAEMSAGLVYACTNDEEVNARIGAEAKRLNIPVNVASAAEQGSFITPNVIRRGELVLSVSASGAGPAVSRKITQELERQHGAEYEQYTALAAAVRQRVKQTVASAEKRRELLRSFAELNLLGQIRSGGFQLWTDQQIDEWIVKG